MVGGKRPEPRGGSSSGRPVVFVSHASRDAWVAKQIGRSIAAAGAGRFLDVVDIEVGDDFDSRIRAGLQRCTELLVLLTPASIDRRWIWIEVGGAWAAGKRVIGVVAGMTVEELLRQPDLPVVLQRKDLVDINELDRYFRQLRARARRHRRSDGR